MSCTDIYVDVMMSVYVKTQVNALAVEMNLRLYEGEHMAETNLSVHTSAGHDSVMGPPVAHDQTLIAFVS